MKSKNKIIVCQDKEVFLYNTKLLRKEWSLEIKHKVGSIARFDNLVLISSYNWWGKVFSKFINFSSGETVLDISENILDDGPIAGIIRDSLTSYSGITFLNTDGEGDYKMVLNTESTGSYIYSERDKYKLKECFSFVI